MAVSLDSVHIDKQMELGNPIRIRDFSSVWMST